MDQLTYLEELYGEQEFGIPVMGSSTLVLAPGNSLDEVPPVPVGSCTIHRGRGGIGCANA